MKIKVEVEIPDGEYCGDCEFYGGDEYHRHDCILFEELELEFNFGDGVADFKKCKKCLEACTK